MSSIPIYTPTRHPTTNTGADQQYRSSPSYLSPAALSTDSPHQPRHDNVPNNNNNSSQQQKRTRTPVKTNPNGTSSVVLSSSLTAPTAAFNSAVAERKRQQQRTADASSHPAAPADAPHGKSPFLYTSVSSHQRQAKYDKIRLEEKMGDTQHRQGSGSPTRSPRSPRGDHLSTKEAAEMALRHINSKSDLTRYESRRSSTNPRPATAGGSRRSDAGSPTRRSELGRNESSVSFESKRRGHGYKSVFDQVDEREAEARYHQETSQDRRQSKSSPRHSIHSSSASSPPRGSHVIPPPSSRQQRLDSRDSSSDRMEVIEMTTTSPERAARPSSRLSSFHSHSQQHQHRGGGGLEQHQSFRSQVSAGSAIRNGASSPPSKRRSINYDSESDDDEDADAYSTDYKRSVHSKAAPSSRGGGGDSSRPLSPVRSLANLKELSRHNSHISQSGAGAASPLRGGLITPDSSVDSDVQHTASHLKNMNRQELVEQLTQYASAFVSERESHDATKSRLMEAEGLADTSTSMAEDAEKTCEHLRDRVGQLTDTLMSVQQQLTTARADHDELLEEHGALKHKYAAQEKRNVELQVKIEALEGEMGPLVKGFEELRLAADRHTRDLALAESKRETALEVQQSKHEAEKEHLQNALHRAEEEVKRLQDQAMDADRSQQHLIRDHQREMDSAEAEVKKAENIIDALRVELRDVGQYGDKERQAHVKQEEVLEREIETLKTRCASLSSQYEQASDRRNELEREMVTLREGHLAMQAKVKASLATLESSDSEKERIRLLERQNSEMERQIQELRKTLTQYVRR